MKDYLKNWEVIIGLEIHVELNTKSKIFSSAPNRFGDEPNTNISEVCTGQPGSLPVLNKEVVRKAVQFGCAVNAKVAKFSKFDRKSYFYPDSPRNFQITQFDQPIVVGGSVIADVGDEIKAFAVNRAHLEDDAGMLKHFSSFAGVDYNRAGVPLLEIVSEPCIHTPQEAVSYSKAIRAIMQYIDASDCNMEEGSLRIDANISVRPKGEKTLRTKTEIKNMNSFSNMELALEGEIKRQIIEYENNPDKDPKLIIDQATYRFDPEKKSIVLMRRKEHADDYRYFPEPDLPPVILTDEYISEIKEALPELPYEREKRYINELGIPHKTAAILVNNKLLSDYFEESIKHCTNVKAVCNWIIVEFTGRLKDSDTDIVTSGVTPQNIAKLVNLIDNNTITGKIAKMVADDMVKFPNKDCEEIVKENPNYSPISDSGELDSIILRVFENNPKSVNDYLNGKDRAFGFLVGQVMKETKGKASPQIVNKLLTQKLEKKNMR